MEAVLEKGLNDAALAIEQLKQSDNRAFIQEVAESCVKCFKKGGKLLIAGNGGSLCDAQHFAEELTGYFRGVRRPLPAIVLSEPGHITCVSNDEGFGAIFERPVEALGKKEDLFIGLTTSGNSENLVRAFQKAKELGLTTVSFLGKSGGQLKGFADHEMLIEGFEYSDRIQEAHMCAIHLIIELIELMMESESQYV